MLGVEVVDVCVLGGLSMIISCDAASVSKTSHIILPWQQLFIFKISEYK
jgi:hypothetical protein